MKYLTARREFIATAAAAATATAAGTVIGNAPPLPDVDYRRKAVLNAIPRASDISLSSRFTNEAAPRLAQIWGATRLDWTYSLDRDFFARVRASGVKTIGGTINACMPDQVGGDTYLLGRQKKLDGSFVVAPWMKNEPVKRHWGCVNNPVYEQIVLARAVASLKAGADYLQFDDAALSIPSVDWGACWCDHCRDRGRELGIALETGMLKLQRQSTERFVRRLRVKLNDMAGRYVVMSANNFGGRRSGTFSGYDFGMCEIEARQLDGKALAELYRSVENNNWHQSVTIKTADPMLNRAAIATVHACGGNCVIPWDVYISTGQRYYGRPIDYIDCYRMVRYLGPLLDDGQFPSFSLENVLTKASLIALNDNNVYAILRKKNQKLLIHFVPWKEAGNTFKVEINPSWHYNQMEHIDLVRRKLVVGKSLRIPNSRWSVLAIDCG